MAHNGHYIWQRHDLKPNKEDMKFLNYVEREHQRSKNGVASLNLDWSPPIISAQFLNALEKATKIK